MRDVFVFGFVGVGRVADDTTSGSADREFAFWT